jgi:hypothetical protein
MSKLRDLEADLAICEAATPGPFEVSLQGVVEVTSNGKSIAMVCDRDTAKFFAEAREGWPAAIRYAMKLENEIDRLRNEIDILQDQLNQRGCMA